MQQKCPGRNWIGITTLLECHECVRFKFGDNWAYLEKFALGHAGEK